jgi:hypothetical protein
LADADPRLQALDIEVEATDAIEKRRGFRGRYYGCCPGDGL